MTFIFFVCIRLTVTNLALNFSLFPFCLLQALHATSCSGWSKPAVAPVDFVPLVLHAAVDYYESDSESEKKKINTYKSQCNLEISLKKYPKDNQTQFWSDKAVSKLKVNHVRV